MTRKSESDLVLTIFLKALSMSFGFLSGLVACKKIIFLTLKFKFSRTFLLQIQMSRLEIVI